MNERQTKWDNGITDGCEFARQNPAADRGEAEMIALLMYHVVHTPMSDNDYYYGFCAGVITEWMREWKE